MNATVTHNTVPRGAILGAGALAAFTIVAALLGRMTGVGVTTAEYAAPVLSRDLQFADEPDGSVLILSYASGRTVGTILPNTDHFVRSTLRGLIRTRRAEQIGSEPPFRLSRLADGHLTIEDTATGRRIDLAAFGKPNAGAFASILDAAAKAE